MNNYKYDSKLGIQSIESGGIRVLTLMQSKDIDDHRAAFNAYVGARYSRSSDSIEDIADSVNQIGGQAAGDRLSRIYNLVDGYGHSSVGDMAMLFVAIEGVPGIVASRFFYYNPTANGQERSTRYQNYSGSKPSEYMMSILPSGIDKEYSSIFESMIRDYSYYDSEAKSILGRLYSDKGVKAARDISRMLLPIGTPTNYCAVMSARAWSREISRLLGSHDPIDVRVGGMLYDLLSHYNGEARGLIKHTTASRIDVLKRYISQMIEPTNSYKVVNNHSQMIYERYDDALITNALMYNNPMQSPSLPDKYKYLMARLGEIMSPSGVDGVKVDNHSEFHWLSNGAINIYGVTDLGTLKDLCRHRSIHKMVPFYERYYEYDDEYILSEHIEYTSDDDLIDLRNKMEESLFNTYSRILRLQAQDKNDNILASACQSLLPHAHKTGYKFGGSANQFQYIINLRIKDGGHINYRRVVDGWLDNLKDDSSIWQAVDLPRPRYFELDN